MGVDNVLVNLGELRLEATCNWYSKHLGIHTLDLQRRWRMGFYALQEGGTLVPSFSPAIQYGSHLGRIELNKGLALFQTISPQCDVS